MRNIIRFSIQKKGVVAIFVALIVFLGAYSTLNLPIDAVPDITNNQVQVVTVSPTLSPQEVEKLITQPLEVSLRNIMNVEEIRSVSRFGLSVVTIVFAEDVPVLDARQLVNEQIQAVAEDIPDGIGKPEMMPISTGLGEIYQYVLEVDSQYRHLYDAMELRTIQDWIVCRHLSGIPGIVEINSFGGYLKQYEVALDVDQLYAMNISITQIYDALANNNQSTGGSYIEKAGTAYYIRSEGMISSVADIEQIVVDTRGGIPIHIRDIAKVRLGHPKRFGALTMDGEGECVGGIAMMLRGANANEVTQQLAKRVEEVQKMLPKGVRIEPYLNRSELVQRNISTVIFNLLEGACIVFLVLMFFLGDVRAGLICASVIPLAMLFAIILMQQTGVSANLMSLGAIDFGIVVDGSIVILEGVMAYIYRKEMAGHTYEPEEMHKAVEEGASKVVTSASFAVLIILIVFLPILSLTGIEGKYFNPMAKTLVFCIIGAFLLSLTYVPMMASLFLKRRVSTKPTLADIFFRYLTVAYMFTLKIMTRFAWTTLSVAAALTVAAFMLFTKLGAEFIPTLDEGDFAMQMTLPVGKSLTESVNVSLAMEKALKEHFPEIKHVVAKIGTAEVPTDPMSVETADVVIVMKPFNEWTSAASREEMMEKMKEVVDKVGGAEYNFSQPIQLRFNELMSGAKADIAIILYGEDLSELSRIAYLSAAQIEKVKGVGDVIVEQGMGLPQLLIQYDRTAIARYGLRIQDLNTVIRTAYSGETAGVVFENERRFDLVLRLSSADVHDVNLDQLFVPSADGTNIPLSEVASITYQDGPMQINRDATKRRIIVGVNVRGGNTSQVVEDIQAALKKNVTLPPGYYFEYGGSFENLQNAINTLSVVIPIALLLILVLLFFAFKNFIYTLVVFSTVPLSMVGGIVALWLRGMPFSVSAGVGFIALFGVAVLNGILMINNFRATRKQGKYIMATDRVLAHGAPHILRPVILTGLVASFGFLPMAVATSAGAEVQRPLATVVIGGLLVSTFLTLVVIPVAYHLIGKYTALMLRRRYRRMRRKSRLTIGVIALLLVQSAECRVQSAPAQTDSALCTLHSALHLTLTEAIGHALKNHPRMFFANHEIERVQATKGEIWDVGNTSFEFSYGKLNGDFARDYEISLTQPLGSPVTPYYKNALLKTQISNAGRYRDIVARELTAEVSRAYANYQYAHAMLSLYTQQRQIANQIRDVVKLQHEQGDISSAERNMINTQTSDIHTRYIHAQRQLQLAQRQFAWSCYAQSDAVPADTLQTAFSLGTAASRLSLTSSYTDYFAGQVEEKQKAYKLEKAKYFPELSIGWNNQRIDPLRNLNSFTIGVSFPLVFVSQRSRVKQSRMEWMHAEETAKYKSRELMNKVDELRIQLAQQKEQLDYLNTVALPEADALQQTAMVQFREGDTDILQLMRDILSVISTREKYIETLYLYNISVIEIELYTDK